MEAQASEQLNRREHRRNKMTNEKPLMATEKKPTEERKKIRAKPLPVDKEKANAIEQGREKVESETKEKPEEKPAAKKKKEEKQIVKKEEAIASGASLPISKKHSMYICRFIKGKSIDRSPSELEEVI